MDTERFDNLTSALAETRTRRGAFQALAAAAFGAASLGVLGTDQAEARRRGSRKRGRVGRRGATGGAASPSPATNGGNGNGNARADRCGGPVGICNADPVRPYCGRTAEGLACACERAVEGNNVCVNSGADNVCDTAVECTSTDGPEATSCRNQVGFHFFCQEAKRSGNQFCGCGFGTQTGRVCVPECDNTNPY